MRNVEELRLVCYILGAFMGVARSDYHVAMKVEEQEVCSTLSTLTDLPNLKVETQNLVKSYMQDHELHTRDHAHGELRLRSEARPAQLT